MRSLMDRSWINEFVKCSGEKKVKSLKTKVVGGAEKSKTK